MLKTIFRLLNLIFDVLGICGTYSAPRVKLMITSRQVMDLLLLDSLSSVDVKELLVAL